MSENIRPCRCLLAEVNRQDIADDIKARIEKLSESEKAPGGEYASRLEKCRECEHLSDGTCLKCGCYPEFRAAFAKNRCPVKKW